ncbi:MAG: divalent-cation tolerance protein CutA [Acidobacteriota bacterium]
MNEILVLSTVDSPELARKIATALVEAGDAACVSIVPGLRSVYRWQGKVCDDKELLLLIKTAADRFDAVRTRVRALHSYEVPEIIALPITAGDTAYLDWLHGQLAPAP